MAKAHKCLTIKCDSKSFEKLGPPNKPHGVGKSWQRMICRKCGQVSFKITDIKPPKTVTS